MKSLSDSWKIQSNQAFDTRNGCPNKSGWNCQEDDTRYRHPDLEPLKISNHHDQVGDVGI